MVTFNCLLTGERSDERSQAQIYSTLSSSCQAEFRLGHPAEFHKHNKLHSRSTISEIISSCEAVCHIDNIYRLPNLQS